MTTKLWSLADLEEEFRKYEAAINASNKAVTTKFTYVTHARRFLRYLRGESVI